MLWTKRCCFAFRLHNELEILFIFDFILNRLCAVVSKQIPRSKRCWHAIQCFYLHDKRKHVSQGCYFRSRPQILAQYKCILYSNSELSLWNHNMWSRILVLARSLA